ncbi:FG-GAP-like repeat-containing protein [Streptomyces sp. NPDC097619]|uniref:FG-GAP-like repeat-containing protein n=1 Tax=Streptomyces sp. NPDC097619 TaxID=3157228 RepID=UPI00331C97B0
MSPLRPRPALAGGVLALAASTILSATPSATAAIGATTTDNAYAPTAKIVIGNDDPTRACSGVLVDPQWILTAKSCFAAKDGSVTAGKPKMKATVTVGRVNLTAGTGLVTEAVELVPRADRDVVLVKLAQRAMDVDPVLVADTAATVGEELKTAGFGRTQSEWVPNKLRVSTFTVTGAAATSVALDPKGTASLCKGDLGGPALRENDGVLELVALHAQSWQGGCLGETETRRNAVDTPVHDLGPWIAKTTFRVQDDVTNDGIADLAAIWNDGTLHVYPGDKTTGLSGENIGQSFGTSLKTMKQIAKGDFTNDGIADLAAIWNDGTLHIYKGDGKGKFTAAITVTTGTNTWGTTKQLTAGDFTGDGNADLMAVWNDGSLRLYKGKGNGQLFPATKITVGANTWGTVKLLPGGDFDGDSIADLMAVWHDGTLHAYKGDGKGQIKDGRTIALGGNTWGTILQMTAGDYTGDGIADLMAIWNDGTLHLYKGDGNGSITAQTPISYGGNTWRTMLQLT